VTYKPERFRKLVTLNVPPQESVTRFLFSPEQLQRSWYVWFFQLPGLPEMAVPANDYAFIDKLWRDWSPGYTPPEPYMRALKDTFSSPGCLEAALGYYRQSFGGAPAEGEAAKVAAAAGPVTIPSLYLHGADDGCLGADLIDEAGLKAAFPGGVEFEIVPGVGHFLLMEDPDVVNAKIVSFLRS
jgi:pimeloyl-ACP methyl ester carboxylesterase